MTFSSCILSLAFAAVATGFTIRPSFSHYSHTSLFSQTHEVLSDIDIMCLINTAEFCVQEHCPVDDNDALLNTLADQEELLCQRVKNLDMAMDAPVALPHISHKFPLLNDMDLMCMMNVASLCKNEVQECSLDDRDAVMVTLSQQREAASSRVVELAHEIATIIQTEGAPGRDVVSLRNSLRTTLSAEELAKV